MTKTVDQAIAELLKEIAAEEASTNKKKETVNTLCGVIGQPPRFVIADPGDQPIQTSFRTDEFFGEPLASSVRSVLERSKATGASALDVDAIYDALIAGGFVFDAKSDATAKRSMAISLSKNTSTFTRLPNGTYGLRQWYKSIPSRRSPTGTNGGTVDDDELVELEDANFGGSQQDDEVPALPAPDTGTSTTPDEEGW